MNKTALATLATLSLFAASSVFATPTPSTDNLVKNGSFEKYSVVNGVTTSVADYSAWTRLGNEYNQSNKTADNLEIQKVGGRFDFATTSFDNTSYYLELNANRLGAISQTLTMIDQQSYTLTFGYADRAGSTGPSIIEVWLGDKLQDIVSTDTTSWSTYTRTVTGSGATELKFVSKGPAATPSYGSFIDGVSVTAVPEPASYAMLLAGLGVMGTIARRRSKAAQS